MNVWRKRDCKKKKEWNMNVWKRENIKKMEHDFMEDFESIYLMIFSRGHATPPCRVGWLVHPSIRW